MGIVPGTPFAELPPGFACPVCGVGKEGFLPVEDGSCAAPHEANVISASVLAVIQQTPTIKTIRFSLPARAEFKPGQYLRITLEGKQTLTRCLSISSSPTETGYLEVTKRITQSDFSQILNEVKPGYQVDLSYPLGTFTFADEYKKIALLSGGIGITPLRSISRYVADKGLATDVCLIYSNRAEEEIAFRSEFDAMHKSVPSFKAVHTLSRPEPEWLGRKGRIDAGLIKQEVPDYFERHFFVCGPPQMVESLCAILRHELNVPESQVLSENFTGY